MKVAKSITNLTSKLANQLQNQTEKRFKFDIPSNYFTGLAGARPWQNEFMSIQFLEITICVMHHHIYGAKISNS